MLLANYSMLVTMKEKNIKILVLIKSQIGMNKRKG